MAFEKIKNWFSTRLAMRSLRDELQGKEWLRQVLLKITTDLNGLESAEEHPFLDQTDEQGKKDIASRLSGSLIGISQSQNPVLENRKWVVSLVNEHARLLPIFTSKDDSESGGWSHPCIFGFHDDTDLIVEVIETSFSELLQEVGDLERTYQALRVQSLQLNYELGIANLTRMYLGDYKEKEDGLDWYRPYEKATTALVETEMRDKLGLPSPCDLTKIRTEQSFIQINLLSGKDNPLEGVIFAKSNPAWRSEAGDE